MSAPTAPRPGSSGDRAVSLPGLLLALAIGGAGGYVFSQFRVPLAWMIGAMCATTAAALAGAPVRASVRLRRVMSAILGVMLGSAFTPETVGRAGEWLPSLVTLLAYVALVTGTIVVLLRRLAGFDLTTAYFSASPGGLSEMVLISGAMGADDRLVSLMHSMRVLLTVMIIPFWFRFFYGYESTGMSALGRIADVRAMDAVVLTACAVAGSLGARWARIPAGALMGPLLLSAVVHLMGLTAARPPGELVAIAQVVIGVTVGCRFAGVPLRRVLGVLGMGVLSTAFMLGGAAIAARALEALTGLEFAALLLAFSPGGLAEMTLISLSLGIDTAFVSTHHLTRIIFIVALAPLAFRVLARKLAPPRD